MYTIEHEYGHYVVKRDGVFYCSADTYGEALMDIAEVEKEGDDELLIIAKQSDGGNIPVRHAV